MRTQPFNELDKFLKSPYLEIWQIGCATGLRISDIITLKVSQIKTEKPTIHEQKTGKSKRIYIPRKVRAELLKKCADKSDDDFVFSSKSSSGHLTRQAVFKAFKKASKTAQTKKNIGTHSMRKNYALKQYQKEHNLKYVQTKLNHDNMAETALYLLDEKE